MMRSLTLKLTLAFLVVSLTGIALVAVFIWTMTSREFDRFNFDKAIDDYKTAVTTYYENNGSWNGIADAFTRQGLIMFPGQKVDLENSQNVTPPLPPFILSDPDRRVIIPIGPYQAGSLVPTENSEKDVLIIVDGQVVGHIISTGWPRDPNPLETRYIQRIALVLSLSAAGAVLIAVLLGLVLARSITRPVRELTAATRLMAQGNLNQQVQVRSRDELGELTHAFNKMSADLESANQQRKQMTADIAHDLRTPLSVITGYLEGLKDGILKPTLKRFSLMHDEAIHLQRLVEDLRTLTLADAGELSMNPVATPPAELIERLAVTYQHLAEKNNIRLQTVVEENLPELHIDPDRVLEAMSNLVMNALRFTPAGGEIILAARRTDGQVMLQVQDNGAGIAPEDLPHIFDRFYRGDDSRQEGGSGLGLAIAKSIIELHSGQIHVESGGPGLGSRFTIRFNL